MLKLRASFIVAVIASDFCASGCDAVDRRIRQEGAQGPKMSSEATAVPRLDATTASIHLTLGTPYDAFPADDTLLSKEAYVVSYNRFRNAPNWVAWRLTAEDIGAVGRTKQKFSPDPDLPAGIFRVHHNDYVGGGYDHGHLCPSAQRTSSEAANRATFLTTNILPQRHALNAGAWEGLEQWTTAMAKRGYVIYSFAGGIWPRACATDRLEHGSPPGADCPSLGRSHDPALRVAIPSSVWKVLVLISAQESAAAVRDDTLTVAVDMPNDGSATADWHRYITTIDTIESRSGYELLANVPEAVQRVLEARPYTGK